MNKTVLMLFTLVLGGLSIAPAAELPAKVQIAAQKKHNEVGKAKIASSGKQAKATNVQSYVITIQNRTKGELKNLTVDYLIFVERQKLGQKKGDETVERVTGTKAVDSLGREPLAVATDPVTLVAENLVGGYIYRDGTRIKAEDSLIGVWVRVSQDGEIIAEYAVPTSAMNRGWDKK
jgi:hypothetical protein